MKPSSERLKHFEKDPVAALLHMAINTGLHRFAGIQDLYDACGELHSEIPKVRCAIDSLMSEIDENTMPSDTGKIVENFKSCFNLKAPLFGCACCGVRNFQMGSEREKLFIEVQLTSLEKLQYTVDQQKKFGNCAVALP